MPDTLLKNKILNQEVLTNLQTNNGVLAPYMFAYFNAVYSENNTELVFPEGIKYISDYVFYYVMEKYGKNRIWILNQSLRVIGDYAFAYISNPAYGVSLVLNDGLEFIGDNAFLEIGIMSTTNETFTIPNSVVHVGKQSFNTSGRANYITTINWSLNCHIIPTECFYYCPKVTSINNLDNVYYINNNAFAGCNSLTSLIVPELRGCSYNAFESSGIKTLTVGPNLTSIGTGGTSNAIKKSSITTINVIGDENCITAQTFSGYTAGQLNNATIVYNYTPPSENESE